MSKYVSALIKKQKILLILIFTLLLLGVFSVIGLSIYNILTPAEYIAQSTQNNNSASTTSSDSGYVIPTGAGAPTIACKLGGNSATNLTSSIAGRSTELRNSGINFGWILGIINKPSEVDYFAQVINDYGKDGTNVIIRMCSGANGDTGGCEIETDGIKYGEALWALAKEVNYPFWVIAGHNEPNGPEWRDPGDEFGLTRAIVNSVRKQTLDDATIGSYDARLALRNKINFISPVMNASNTSRTDTSMPMEDYLGKFYHLLGGEIKYLGVNAYDANTVAKSIKYAKTLGMQLIITESAPGKNSAQNPDIKNPTKFYTNEEIDQWKNDVLLPFIGDPTLTAVLLFNGVPLTPAVVSNPAQQKYAAMQDPTDACQSYMDNSGSSYYTHSSFVNGCKSSNSICRMLCANNKYEGDILQKTSVNWGWKIFFESQIEDLSTAAGCSNTFTRACNNQHFIKTRADGNAIFSKSLYQSKNYVSPVSRVAFDDFALKSAITKTESIEGFVDLPDVEPIGKDISDDLPGDGACVLESPIDDGCDIRAVHQKVLPNVLADFEYSGKVVTTSKIDFPSIRFFASNNPEGTEDLNFTPYSEDMRLENTLSDPGRVGDLTAQISSGGKKSFVSIPDLGRAFDQYNSLHTRNYVDILRAPTKVESNKITYSSAIKYYSVVEPGMQSKLFDANNYSNKYTPSSSRSYQLSTNVSKKGLDNYLGNGLLNVSYPANTDSRIVSITSKNSYVNETNEYKELLNDTTDILTAQYNPSSVNADEQYTSTRSDITSVKASETDYWNRTVKLLDKPIELDPKVVAECAKYGVPLPTTTKYIEVTGTTSNRINQELPLGKAVTYSIIDPANVIELCAQNRRILPPRVTIDPYLKDFLITDQGKGDVASVRSHQEGPVNPANGVPVTVLHVLTKVNVSADTIQSLSGGLRILKSSWEKVEQLDNYSDPVYSTCYPKNVGVKADTYTRVYSVSNSQNLVSASTTIACNNPDASAIGDFKRPMTYPARNDYNGVDFDRKDFAHGESYFPFLGTAILAQEYYSKVQFAPDASNPLKKCDAGGDKEFACLCDKSKPEEVLKYDKFEIFLCRNKMMTYDELVQNQLIFPSKLPADLQKTDGSVDLDKIIENTDFNPNKCNLWGSKSLQSVTGNPDVDSLGQVIVGLTPTQSANARMVIELGRKYGATDKQIMTALVVAMQESKLINLPGGDADSCGLYQQRPATGWGQCTEDSIRNPTYAITLFYADLMQNPNLAKEAVGKAPPLTVPSNINVEKAQLWCLGKWAQRPAEQYAIHYAQWELMMRAVFTEVIGQQPNYSSDASYACPGYFQ